MTPQSAEPSAFLSKFSPKAAFLATLEFAWFIISSWASVILFPLALMLLGNYFSDKNNTSGWFIAIPWALTLATAGTITGVCGLIRARMCVSSLGKFDFLENGKVAALFILIPALIVQYAVGVCSYNWPNQLESEKVMVVDGEPITDSQVRWFIPIGHDIQKIPLDATADWHKCSATTKDGLLITASLKVHLRRTDDPNHWILADRATPSRQQTLQSLFEQICSQMTAKEINNDNTVIENELVRDDRLRKALSPAFMLDGLIEAKEVEAHPYIVEPVQKRFGR